MRTIAIIPARGGSKGIPRKNIIELCGHPLIAWTIGCCRECGSLEGIYVSTDDGEIAGVSRRYGAEVVERPAELATDTADSESAVIHALEAVETGLGKRADAVLFLQATSPLREASELEGALAKFQEEKLDSLFSAASLGGTFVWRRDGDRMESWNYDFNHRKRRQDIEGGARQYVETGSFYITRTQLLKERRNRLGGRIGIWEVPMWKRFEIDEPEDLRICEQFMRLYKIAERPPREV